jgi:hypothetical protein
MDEILARVLLGSPGFRHMIRAVADGVDSSPPLYWSAMWAWTRVFGLSELSLRMCSAAATGGAFLGAWVLLLALVVSDAAVGRFRPLCYLATPLGWLAFLPWVPSFIQQSKIGEPRFWITAPAVCVLWDPASYLFGIPLGVVEAVVLLAVAAFAIDRAKHHGKAPCVSALCGSPVSVAGVLLVVLVPVSTWLISFLIKPVWLDRYQLPALLG